jgi:hypothetical protein
VIDVVGEANRTRAARSHARHTIPCQEQFCRVEDLPSSQRAPSSSEIELIFTSFFWYSVVANEQRVELAHQYVAMYRIWCAEWFPEINSINLREEGNTSPEWGEEQKRKHTVHFEGAVAKAGVALDVPLELPCDLVKYREFVGPDLSVRDPVREHDRFRNRCKWTESEKAELIELFWAHPHQFSEIAEMFPNRRRGDIVEMYYLLKKTPEMEARRPNKAKRPTKKVYTEGKVNRK